MAANLHMLTIIVKAGKTIEIPDTTTPSRYFGTRVGLVRPIEWEFSPVAVVTAWAILMGIRQLGS